MKLLTEELIEKFEKYPLYSQDGLSGDAKVIAKFFAPIGQATWLITEGSKETYSDENGKEITDYTMFGFCNLIGIEYAELGYVTLNELQSIELPMGLGVERDLSYDNRDINLRDACKKEFGIVPEYLKEKVKVQVLQLSDTEEYYTKMFMPSKSFKGGANSVKAQDYECVYKSKEYYCDLNNKADTCELLENLFYKYNKGDKPDGYKGHSLSVSDVLILECEGMSKAIYFDRVAFVTLPETFLEEWKKDIKSEFASMSKVEKEALIEGVEMALDYQDKVDKDTMKLYEMAIEERQKEQEEPDICD